MQSLQKKHTKITWRNHFSESKQLFKELRVKGFHFNEKEPLFSSLSTEKKLRTHGNKKDFQFKFFSEQGR